MRPMNQTPPAPYPKDTSRLLSAHRAGANALEFLIGHRALAHPRRRGFHSGQRIRREEAVFDRPIESAIDRPKGITLSRLPPLRVGVDKGSERVRFEISHFEVADQLCNRLAVPQQIAIRLGGFGDGQTTLGTDR